MFEGINLPHELFLTTRQKTKLRNAFENNLSADIKLSQTQISKIFKSGFLGASVSKIASPLMKVAVLLTKNILAPLGITAAVLAIDEVIQMKIHISRTTTLNEKMNEGSTILLKGITKTLETETKE